MKAKDTLGGSGRHKVYDQQGSYETHNMTIWMWVPLCLSKNGLPMGIPNEPGIHQCELIWQGNSPSSPEAARGKRTYDQLSNIFPQVDAEISLLISADVMIQKWTLYVEFMNDGNMLKFIVGSGRAFVYFVFTLRKMPLIRIK